MRVCIYGAGAMGTVLGAFLTKGGVEVELITRNRAHVEGLRKNGAQITCVADKKEFVIPVNALLPEEMQGEYDVVFLMTKQRYNGEIVQTLSSHLKADGVLCTTQNGLPEESLLGEIGAERTYGCVASYGANFIGGGKVALTSALQSMRMQVGGYCNDGEKTPLITRLLSHVSIVTGNAEFATPTDNLIGARWSKLAINSAFSGLSVVTGQTFGEIAKRSKSRKIALGILRECVKVATASGVCLEKMQGKDMQKWLCGKTPLQAFVAYVVLPFTIKRHRYLRSGMLADVENGKKCEIDFINGVVTRTGKKVGVATPLNEQIVRMVHGIENGLYEITPKNLDFIRFGKEEK